MFSLGGYCPTPALALARSELRLHHPCRTQKADTRIWGSFAK